MSTLARLLMGAVGNRLPTVIGEAFGGGFYVGTLDGYAHILASKSAETTLTWGGRGEVSGAVSTTDSAANTTTLVNSSIDYPAAQYCRAYRGGGLDDWDLPASDVLNLLWLNVPPGGAATPAAFKTGGVEALTVPDYYWSSTEGSDLGAWGQRFSDGFQLGSISKASARLVRPVRRIQI